MKTKPFLIVLLSLIVIGTLIFQACKKDKNEEPKNESEFIDEKNFTELTTDAVILPPSVKVVSITENQIVIESDLEKVTNLDVGQIIVSGKSAGAPNGYARKIIGIANNNNIITIQTVQAGLDEVYSELSIDTKIEIDYENFKPIDTKNDKSTKDGFRPIKVKYNNSTNVFEIEVVLYDQDKDYDTKLDQVTYVGTLEVIENNSHFVFNIRPFTKKIFYLSNEMDLQVNNTVSVSSSLSFEKEEILIAKIPLTMMLPTSFVVNAYLEVILGIEGDLTGTITIENETTINTLASLSYDETNGWISPGGSTLSSSTSFDGSIELNVKPYTGPGIAIEFVQYKNASAGVFLEGYLQFHAELNTNSGMSWDFGYGLELKGIAEVTVLNTFIDIDYEQVFWEHPYTILAQGPDDIIINTSPVTSVTQTTALCGGEVIDDGGNNITGKGVCWSTSPNPTTNNEYTIDGIGVGVFVSSLTGLNEFTTYFVKAYAINSSGTVYGNQVEFTTLSAGNTAPVAVFLVDPTSGPTSTIFSFDASDSYDNEDPTSNLQVRWDWENDGEWDIDWNTNKTETHQYGSEGTYTVKMEVKDTEGALNQATNNVLVTSENNTPPTATFTVDPFTGTTATVFTFDASGSFDAEDPTSELQVRWDFDGDGNWDTDWDSGKMETHQYDSEEVYTTELEVKDTEGLTSTFSRLITVTNGGGGTGTYTDLRDGQTYNTIEIGSQTWFAENLNYTTANSWWYNNSSVNGAVYGRLYTWEAALTACPSGWKLPNEEEWLILKEFLGGIEVAGGKMKETGLTHWEDPNTGATNESGFTGLPGGIWKEFNGEFDNIGISGNWWSMSEYTSTRAWNANLVYNHAKMFWYANDKVNGMSVRCLKE